MKLVVIILFSSPLTEALTCYGQNGQAIGAGNGWDSGYANNICNASAAISACCSTLDLCLSNGLCVDTGTDNALAVEGCTDQNWGPPCVHVCLGKTLLCRMPPIKRKTLIMSR